MSCNHSKSNLNIYFFSTESPSVSSLFKNCVDSDLVDAEVIFVERLDMKKK